MPYWANWARVASRAIAFTSASSTLIELLDNYSKEMLKKRETVDGLVNRAIESKLSAAVKGVVKLKNKKVTVDEFNKLFEPAAEAAPKAKKSTKK